MSKLENIDGMFFRLVLHLAPGTWRSGVRSLIVYIGSHQRHESIVSALLLVVSTLLFSLRSSYLELRRDRARRWLAPSPCQPCTVVPPIPLMGAATELSKTQLVDRDRSTTWESRQPIESETVRYAVQLARLEASAFGPLRNSANTI